MNNVTLGNMADDLDDEWWMPKENSDNSDSEIKKTGKNVQIKNTKKRKSVPEKTQPVIQKKRKRRKITDALQRKKPCAADADDFNKILNKEVENLTVVERSELMLEDRHFLPNNDNLDKLSFYLKSVIPKWHKLVASATSSKTNSPIIMVISGSAKRAADLNREASAFKEKCTSVKLFAKHMKIEDQEAFLNKHQVHFGIGTPFRILRLLENNTLTLQCLKYVVLDWNWRDVKSKRMIDIPDIRKVLFQLLSKLIIPHIMSSKTKLGLF